MSLEKSNKKAFVVALAVIFLCLVSIAGATLALLTDSTGDGKIGINTTAGNLEVDIVDASDSPTTIVGEVLGFIDSDGNPIDVLFEPGATICTEGFRVKNEGNIPINYIIYVSENKDLPDEFYDAFEVWITTNPQSKDDMVLLPQFDGRVEAGGVSEVYYLVFHMKESAGNEFQDQTYTGIGITVLAVQGNVNITSD